MAHLTASRTKDGIKLSLDGKLHDTYPNWMWPIFQEFMDKPKKTRRDKAVKRRREPKSDMMLETERWCKMMKRSQINDLRRKGWTDKDIGRFLVGHALESRRSWNRMIARDREKAALVVGSEPSVNVEYTIPDTEILDEKLRHLYKFSKRHEVQYR